MRHFCLPLMCLIVSFSTTLPATASADDFSDMRGANYVPSYARNDVQIWMDYDPAVIDRELGYAKRLKLNTVRVFLQYTVYERDPKLFLERFESFLSLCGKHQIRMMPVVFDSCFGEFPDLLRYRDKDWMACPGQNRLGPDDWPKLEQYVRDVVGGHKDDRRIVMWDVMNEPTCTSFNKAEDQQLIWTFLNHFLDYVRQQQPLQPLTVGVEHSSLIPKVLTKINVLCFHNYRRDLREDVAPRAGVGPAARQGGDHQRGRRPPAAAVCVRHAHPPRRADRLVLLGADAWQDPVLPRQPSRTKAWSIPTARASTPAKWPWWRRGLAEARQQFQERPRPKLEEDGMTFEGFWTRWTGAGPGKGRLFYATDSESTATCTFQGKTVDLIHKVGPDCGIAQIAIDGQPAARAELDTYSPTVEWNRRTRLASNLAPGTHVVRVTPTGNRNAASSNCYVQVVGFDSQSDSPETHPTQPSSATEGIEIIEQEETEGTE